MLNTHYRCAGGTRRRDRDKQVACAATHVTALRNTIDVHIDAINRPVLMDWTSLTSRRSTVLARAPCLIGTRGQAATCPRLTPPRRLCCLHSAQGELLVALSAVPMNANAMRVVHGARTHHAERAGSGKEGGTKQSKTSILLRAATMDEIRAANNLKQWWRNNGALSMRLRRLTAQVASKVTQRALREIIICACGGVPGLHSRPAACNMSAPHRALDPVHQTSCFWRSSPCLQL